MINKILFLYLFIGYNNLYAQKNEQYLIDIYKKISSNSDKYFVEKLAKTEKQKFDKTKDSLYLISHNFALLHVYIEPSQRFKQLEIALEVSNINKDRYPFISTHIYYNLALKLETSAPNQSLIFLNNAISNCLLSQDKSLLPHLYHLKGRINFNFKNYDVANEYYQKALALFKFNQILFKASMHNNLGLLAERKKEYKKAIDSFKKGISILQPIHKLTKEEDDFLIILKRNLADSYFKRNEIKEAQKIWNELIVRYKNDKNNERVVIQTTRNLYDSYIKIGNLDSASTMAQFIKKYEGQKGNTIRANIHIFEVLRDHAYRLNNISGAKSYADQIISLNDSILIEYKNNLFELNQVLNNKIIENVNKNFDLKLKNQKNRTNLIISVSVFIIVILILTLILFRNRLQFQKVKTQLEKENNELLDQNLQLNQEKLKNLRFNMNLKHETELALLNKIKKVRNTKSLDAEKIVKELYFELNNLVDIDKRYTQINSEINFETQSFIKQLEKSYPILNEKELQLCVYFKMDLSAKEISYLENLTEGSIRVYKSKIKKKLNIPDDSSLAEFLKIVKC